MNWWIWTLVTLGGIIFLYLFTALCVHICKYGTFKTSSTMTGKTIFITGGTSGIGRVSVVQLYLRGFKVYFTGRNSNAAHDIVQEIASKLRKYSHKSGFISKQNAVERLNEIESLIKLGEFGKSKNFQSEHLTFYTMDMSDFKEVTEVAEKFSSSNQKLDVLLNNAGIWISKNIKTSQGYPITMAVNHLAHMLLIDELYPILKSTPKSRIINVASMGHKGFPGILDDPSIQMDDIFNEKKKDFDGGHQYLRSKFANVLFTRALARVVSQEQEQIKTVSLHPGVIGTGLYRDFNCIQHFFMITLAKPMYMTEFEGAQNNILTSCIEFEKLQNGEYYDGLKVGLMNKKTEPEEYQNEFWDISIDLIESKLGRNLKSFKKFSSH